MNYCFPPSLCAGCQLKIKDQFYLLVADLTWHIQCLRCCVCRVSLETELTCFTREGLIFCKEDYYKQFSKRCTRCNRILSPKDLVMRAKEHIFHVHCFNCIDCAVPLMPGELFGLGQNGVLYCKEHCDSVLDLSAYGTTANTGGAAGGTTGNGGVRNIGNGAGDSTFDLTRAQCDYADSQPVSDGRKTKLKRRKAMAKFPNFCSGANGDLLKQPSLSCGLAAAAAAAVNRPPSMAFIPQKRMRTSFKHQQLRMMKAYFQLNRNPDAKDLKELAQKTGLTKRILQVWFQNARAKYRRSLHVVNSSSASDKSFVNAFSPNNFVSDAASDFSGESSSVAAKDGLRHCLSFSDDSDVNLDIYGRPNSGGERCGSR